MQLVVMIAHCTLAKMFQKSKCFNDFAVNSNDEGDRKALYMSLTSVI